MNRMGFLPTRMAAGQSGKVLSPRPGPVCGTRRRNSTVTAGICRRQRGTQERKREGETRKGR